MSVVWKIGGAAALALVAASYTASAATPEVTAAVNARKANYKEIGGAFKTINDEIKSGAPDMNSVRPLAKDVAVRATNTLKYFPSGSGPESGLKTRAKADIWANQAEFIKIQREMIAAAEMLNAAATKGDSSALASARTKLGGTCKACHDRFRQAE